MKHFQFRTEPISLVLNHNNLGSDEEPFFWLVISESATDRAAAELKIMTRFGRIVQKPDKTSWQSLTEFILKDKGIAEETINANIPRVPKLEFLQEWDFKK